jgi:hypothetical protein
MHHDASQDAPPTSFMKPNANNKHEGAYNALFCWNIMKACEAREHGGDSKQNHQVEGTIMQAKEWTRTFGRCNPVEHAVTKQQSKHECTREHYVKTSNRSHNICNGPLTPFTSTHICNGCCLAPVTYKRARMTPGLASTTPVTNVEFW